MYITTLTVGILEVNCYLLNADGNNETLIVDPGGSFEHIDRQLQADGRQPVGILLTHGHIDHLTAVPDLVQKYQVPVYVHPQDHALYNSPNTQLPGLMPTVEGLPTPIDELPNATELVYAVLHTPGHSPGSVCFHFPDDQVLISGDTLFCGSVGRTDLAGGDATTLKNSLKEQIITLPGDTAVYPGHGPATTLDRERQSNPFLTSDIPFQQP